MVLVEEVWSLQGPFNACGWKNIEGRLWPPVSINNAVQAALRHVVSPLLKFILRPQFRIIPWQEKKRRVFVSCLAAREPITRPNPGFVPCKKRRSDEIGLVKSTLISTTSESLHLIHSMAPSDWIGPIRKATSHMVCRNNWKSWVIREEKLIISAAHK